MSSDIVVKLSSVSKKYTLHHEKPTLVENILKRQKSEEFWALKSINLEVKKGERVGIIGLNGGGKTTLLKIIAGIITPTDGEVMTNGRLASLIEIDAGFHPDLTGEENIYLNGLLLGMSKDEIKSKLRKIIAFADIGSFVDAPIYTYSDGMKLRLGFSIAAHSNPDIFIVDEIITVGDEEFRKKSYQKIQEFFKKNKSIIFVSHNLNIIQQLCPKTLWLDGGKIKDLGLTKEVTFNYLKHYHKV